MASAQNAEGLDNSPKIPKFIVDPFWPKKLPAQDLLGQVAGISVDKDNHIWIIQRPRSLTQYELGATPKPRSATCLTASNLNSSVNRLPLLITPPHNLNIRLESVY